MAGFELYLIRHGIAAERGPEYPDDSRRPLTRGGVESLRTSAAGLVELGVAFDLMVTSPLVRARQTAEVIADVLDGSPRVVASEALAPEGAPADVIRELQRHSRHSRIALVGHEPNIGELAGRLIGTRSPIPFKKGAVCRIDCEALPPAGRAALRWFLPPRVLRKIR